MKRLARQREAWRVALEQLQRDQNWRVELNEWVKDSEQAEVGALEASVSLLLGVAGPLEDAIELHQSRSVHFWENTLNAKGRLEGAYAIIYDMASSPQASAEARQTAEALKGVYNGLAANMSSELRLSEYLTRFHKDVERILKAAKIIELIKNAHEKHDLLVACKLVEDFIVDRLTDLGLHDVQERLRSRGNPEAAQLTSLGKFVINYGYNSMKFYLAWSNIHDILSQLDDRNALASTFERKIGEATRQRNAVQSEIEELKRARTSRSGSETLRKFRLKEMREAYLAGEWFSLNSGVRAPGGPIEEEKKP